jgi:hypothetical protein
MNPQDSTPFQNGQKFLGVKTEALKEKPALVFFRRDSDNEKRKIENSVKQKR